VVGSRGRSDNELSGLSVFDLLRYRQYDSAAVPTTRSLGAGETLAEIARSYNVRHMAISRSGGVTYMS
jgi:hypothetical protein